MRIGLIIYGRLDSKSGGYLYDRQLVHYLRQAGDEVQIISLPWKRYGRHLLHNINSSLLHRLRHASYDILLQDELNHPSLFWLNRKLQVYVSYYLVSIVHHLRSSEIHPNHQLKLYRWIERQYLQAVDGFVFNSETTRLSVEAMVGKQKPYIVSYPAADHSSAELDRESIQKRAYRAGPIRLLFVGNVIPRKACHVLLTALARLPQDSWRLEIVGDTDGAPNYVRRLKQQASSSGISSHINWLGRLSDDDLAEQFYNCQLLVVPSTYEGYGIVYLEAMRCGLPAIGTTSGAAHEIISDGKNGFLVPPNDPEILARRIQTLNEDRSLLARQSIAAQDRTMAQPTWETSMFSVRQFLADLIS